MKPGGFVEAVTRAVNGSVNQDNWEIEYYMGKPVANNCYEWAPQRLPVYMHSRTIALGPEWAEWRRCVMQMSGDIQRAKGWPRVPQETRRPS